MTRSSKIWLVGAVLFSLANVLGVWFHAVQGELLWTGVHGVLALLGAYVARRLAPSRVANY